MPDRIQFSIPIPCHEDWNKMSPSEHGRHCGKCNRLIYDLTEKSDIELLELYKQSRGQLCGVIQPKQLNRSLEHNHYRIFLKNTWICFKAKFRQLATLAGFTLLLMRQAAAQENKKNCDLQSSKFTPPTNDSDQTISNSFFEIRGKVRDVKTKLPVDFANIVLKNADGITYGSTFSDENGEYLLKITDTTLVSKKLALEITYIGYQKLMIQDIVLKKDKVSTIDIEMEGQNAVMLGIIITTYVQPYHPQKKAFNSEEILRFPYR